ncbi:MAG TPA: ABC transporter substrate-binding protein [Acidimicrobiales bacterium]
MVDRKIGRALIALVAMIGLLATACSSDDEPAESTSSTSGSEASAEVNRDGTLKWGYDLVQNGQFSWEPGATPAINSLESAYYLVYGRLMRKTADGTIVPDLAEAVTVVDANTIEIKVRPDQTWHDGAPFDAQSVKAGLDHNLAKEESSSGFGAPFFAVNSVDVVDALTVRLGFDDGTAPGWYGSYAAGAQTTITRPGTYGGNPIGAGPMKVTAYTPEQTMVMERFDDFWNAEEVGFAGIETVPANAASPQSAMAALQSGQADVVTVDTTQLSSMTGPLEAITVSDPSRLMRLSFCRRDEPLSDPRVRLAINKAIDRDAINDAVFEGTAEPAVQMWPEGHQFFNTDVADVLAYDPEGARQVLADAGLSNVTFDLILLNSLSIPEVATVIEQQLADVGITANLTITPDLVGQFLVPQAPGATIFPSTPNPGLAKLRTFSGTAQSNLCSYENEEVNALAAQLGTLSPDSAEAKDLWWQLADIYTEEALDAPLVFASIVGGYDTDRLVLGETYPDGLWVLPDIYTSHMTG